MENIYIIRSNSLYPKLDNIEETVLIDAIIFLIIEGSEIFELENSEIEHMVPLGIINRKFIYYLSAKIIERNYNHFFEKNKNIISHFEINKLELGHFFKSMSDYLEGTLDIIEKNIFIKFIQNLDKQITDKKFNFSKLIINSVSSINSENYDGHRRQAFIKISAILSSISNLIDHIYSLENYPNESKWKVELHSIVYPVMEYKTECDCHSLEESEIWKNTGEFIINEMKLSRHLFY